jgi:hypothetical protein
VTWRLRTLPKEGDEKLAHRAQVQLKKQNIESKLGLFAASFSNEAGVLYVSLQQLFEDRYGADQFPSQTLQDLRDGRTQSKEITLAECTEQDRHLYYQEGKYVPGHPPPSPVNHAGIQ